MGGNGGRKISGEMMGGPDSVSSGNSPHIALKVALNGALDEEQGSFNMSDSAWAEFTGSDRGLVMNGPKNIKLKTPHANTPSNGIVS